MFKYLGLYLQFDRKQDLVSENIEQKLKDWLRVIDSSLLEGRMKAWLVNFYICSKLSVAYGPRLFKVRDRVLAQLDSFFLQKMAGFSCARGAFCCIELTNTLPV